MTRPSNTSTLPSINENAVPVAAAPLLARFRFGMMRGMLRYERLRKTDFT
jgi:hypothetical protein